MLLISIELNYAKIMIRSEYHVKYKFTYWLTRNKLLVMRSRCWVEAQ